MYGIERTLFDYVHDEVRAAFEADPTLTVWVQDWTQIREPWTRLPDFPVWNAFLDYRVTSDGNPPKAMVTTFTPGYIKRCSNPRLVSLYRECYVSAVRAKLVGNPSNVMETLAEQCREELHRRNITIPIPE